MTSHRRTQPEIAESFALNVRTARISDAAAIWRLVQESEALEANSCYAYLLLCTDFSDTCLVAYDGDCLAGFVAGYVPPMREDAVFVWQIGVASRYRGRGVGRQLLATFVDKAATRGAQYLEATVTEDNLKSLRLFRSLANCRGWTLTTKRYFEPGHFADEQHQAEVLLCIGPLKE